MHPRRVIGLLGALFFPALLFAQREMAATWKEADIARCRSGKASGCEALGYPKELARPLAGYLKEKAVVERRKRLERTAPGDPFLSAVARLDLAPEIRAEVTRGLADPTILRTILGSDSAEAVRVAAMTNPALVDQEIFARAAKTEPSAAVRYAAVLRLDDVNGLALELQQDSSEHVRALVAKRATDETVLAELAASKNMDVALAAAVNPHLKSEETLAALLARLDLQPIVRMAISAKRVAMALPGGSPVVSTSPTPTGSYALTSSPSSGGGTSGGGSVYVKGHRRKDGTYVKPHTRRAPRRR